MALPSKPTQPMSPELIRLLEIAARRGPMTAAEMRLQRISWAYGNCAFDNDRITREMVEREHDRVYGKPDTETGDDT